MAAHRQALRHLVAARRGLDTLSPPADARESAAVVARLRCIGEVVTAEPEPGRFFPGPVPMRLGVATTPTGAFPAVVPLAGGTHLAVDADARDPRVAALLRVLVVRLLAAAPPGPVRVLALDTAALGGTFLPLRPLVDAGVLHPPAATEQEVTAELDLAERHARSAPRAPRDELVPSGRELTRLAALTHAGPAARTCVLVAGYSPHQPDPRHSQHPPQPVPLPPGSGVAPPLAATTQIRLTGTPAGPGAPGYAHVGGPPGHPFSVDGTGLAAPVLLDGDPSPAAVAALAERLGELSRRASTLRFADLLPAQPWTESSERGLRTAVGPGRQRDAEPGLRRHHSALADRWAYRCR